MFLNWEVEGVCKDVLANRVTEVKTVSLFVNDEHSLVQVFQDICELLVSFGRGNDFFDE